jgi:type II secretory pathway component GspD/PulD (secretin)
MVDSSESSGMRFGPSIRGSRLALGLGFIALLGLGATARGGEKKPTEFSRGRVTGKAGDTVWFRYQPRVPHAINLAKAVLARHGLVHGKHIWFDLRDDVGLLAITGKRKWVKVARSLLEFLEENQPQIRVKVRIVETQTSRDLQTGLETSLERKSSKDTFFRGFSINNQPKSYLDSILSPTIPFTGTSLGFGTVDDVDAQGNFVSKTRERVGAVTLALRAMGEKQVADLLAKPDLMVVPGEPAEFKIHKQFPYQYVEIRGTSAKVFAKTLPLGVTLKLTLFVVGKDRVQMDVDALVENQAGFVEIGPGTKLPFTSKRQIKTTVTVPSGFEVVVGGLFQNDYSVVEKGVPLLSEIPILGYLFKSYWRVQKRKELLFFIQPKIMETRARLFSPLGD